MAASTLGLSDAEARHWLVSVYHLDKKVDDHLKKKNVLSTLHQVAVEAHVDLNVGLEKKIGNALYKVATSTFPIVHRPYVSELVIKGHLKLHQIQFAIDYLKAHPEPLSDAQKTELAEATGLGLPEFTEEDINVLVAKLIAATPEAELNEKRYGLKGSFLGAAKKESPLKFADPAAVVAAINARLEALLGKESDPINKVQKAPAKKAAPAPTPAPAPNAPATSNPAESEPEDTLPSNVEYPPPEANTELNAPEILAKHLAETGGGVITRFPPEPNGYLHIGHCKAANLDFGYAKRKKGKCILRYDDTNPEAEKQEYIDMILENVRWLGWEPDRITYSSDYFDKLYELAEEMINRGYGYTCSCSSEVMRDKRGNKEECACRAKSKETSLEEFRGMRDGKFEEGQMCLRMKGDMKSPNPCMRDTVAYRIKKTPHPRTGDKWIIYPTYDYTHCIVDSLENITHSLCSLEFNIRRESYEWLNHILGLYCPPQREFSRLDISYTVLSKRRLLKLLSSGVVSGWNDPLMPTLMGVRRRGFRPQALNKLCERVSITRSNNLVDYQLLEAIVREDLEDISNRAFAVFDPLRVVMTNWPEDKIEQIDAPHHITFPERGSRKLPISRVIYIERKDFRTEDDPKYFGLAPAKDATKPKLVRLRYSGFIHADKYETDAEGKVSTVYATFVPESNHKVKGVIHWLAESASGVPPPTAEVRLLDRLFTHPQPGALSSEEFVKYLNPNARRVVKNAMIEKECLEHFAMGSTIQFERHGFFCLDSVDSKPDAPVFNRIVSLKDSFKPAAASSGTC